MEPDEAEAMARLQAGRSKAGTIDLREKYFKAQKRQVTPKSQTRRFLPGNTAFVTMRSIPILTTRAMPKIPSHERDLVFRGVIADDKFSKKSGDDADEEADESGEEEKTIDADGNVVFFHMELHPNVCAQLLWEDMGAILVDFSPGAGMMIKIALLMNFKVLTVALNREHVQVLTRIITKFVRENIQAGNQRFLGTEGENRLLNTMPAKLRLYHEKNENNVEAPIRVKRASPNWEVELNALAEGAPIRRRRRQMSRPRRRSRATMRQTNKEGQERQC